MPKAKRPPVIEFAIFASVSVLCWAAAGVELNPERYQVIGINRDTITASVRYSREISAGHRGLIVRAAHGDNSEPLPIAEVVVEQVFAFTIVLRVVEIGPEQITAEDWLQLEKIVPPEDEQLRFLHDLAEIRHRHQRLKELRDELKTLQRSEKEQTPNVDNQAAEIDKQITSLQVDYDAAYDDLQQRLAGFLNVALNNYPKYNETIEGLQIYTEEAIVNADEIVEAAGDYHKAIDTLQATRNYYEIINVEVPKALKEKIADFEEWRYINRERFDRVVPGMSESEVQEAVGIPFYGNVRLDSKSGITTWLYKRRDSGAAAIFFTPGGQVYSSRFDEIEPK